MKNLTIKQAGLTLIELMISITISGVITLIMITITVYYYGDMLRAQATAELAIESQTVLRRIIEDARLGDSIRSTNQIADTYSPSGGWVTSDPSNVLIIAVPATDSTRQIIYNTADNYPYENEAIYFSAGTTMYRRALKNTSAVGNTTVTTCPSANTTTSCPADLALSKYVTNLSFTFYDVNNATTTNAAQARSVSITINMQRKVYGTTIDFSNTVRTTLRNY